jgi:nucleotide-binding universal stress UspA family protein
LHIFALLGFAQDRAMHVVTAADETDAATETARRASELLARHGALQTRAIGLGDREAGTPSETILGLAKSIDADMIVMGAYGRRGIREMFGSTTRQVLNACPTMLFLHH